MFRQSTFTEDFVAFLVFCRQYSVHKAVIVSEHFEKIKNIIVVFLMVKRGKYQQSFLNTSLFLLVFAIWVAGPIIAEQNPLVGNNIGQSASSGLAVISTSSLANADSTATFISAKPRDTVISYTIKSGDTLASLARRFDISVDTIKWANDLEEDTITAGDTLKIPPVTGIVHKVKSGDTIYSIAKKYKTDAQKIVNFPFNDFSDPDTFAIIPGQTLIVPGGIPPEEQLQYAPAQLAPQFFAGQKGSGNFIWPTTGLITQYPVWYHMALDIANASAPPVLAADSGTVSYAGCIEGGYGCHIIIDHANGYQSLYGHLSSIGVAVGQGVGQGQTIGIMGSTGRSTGTHLHFEIRSGGALLNPLSFLQ